MNVREIVAKSIITPSKLPAADYVVNPYIGCTHRCLYCYARFMKRFSGHEEPWGHFLDVKTNGADLIPLTSKKYKNKTVFLSSVTDPYVHAERKYRLTRSILERLCRLEPKLSIQTKSDLIVRDLDVLVNFRDCKVGMTVTTLEDAYRKELEPCTSSVEERLLALKKIHDAGLKTYVFIGPIMPFVTDWRSIIEQTRDYVDFYMFENLNAFGSVWGDVKQWLTAFRPEFTRDYQEIILGESNYWRSVETQISDFCTANNIAHQIFFHHGKKQGAN